MTTLSQSSVEPELRTVQCDICFPQHIATNTMTELRERGWLLREAGDSADVCAHCRFESQQGRETRVSRAADVPDDATGHLPNMFIVGAAKAGTTSLFRYLDQHPDVAMTRQKELHFFCDPDYDRWLSLYRAEFPVDAAIRGEASTLYTRSPAIPGVAARIASLVPDARLIYLVRDPVERALASYREERFHVTDRRPVEEAFAHPEDPHNAYVAASRYAEQLVAYLEHFGRDQILVLDQRDLATDAAGTVAGVVEFLGLAPYEIDASERHNTADTKLEYGDLGNQLRFSAPARVARRLPPRVRRAVMAPARRLLRRQIAEPELPADLHERLRNVLAPDAARLRELTGLPLAHWCV